VVASLSLPLGRHLESREVAAYRHELRPHADQARQCSISGSAVRTDAVRCTWPAAAPSRGRAVLLGDSNAGHLTEPFVATATAAGLDALVQTRPRCPFVDLVFRKDGVVDRDCRRTYEAQFADLVARPPQLVVLADAGDLELTNDEVAVRDGASPGTSAGTGQGEWAGDPEAKAQRWTAGLERTVSALRARGVAVVLVAPVPRFTGWQPPGECARLRVRLDVSGCGTSRATADARRPNLAMAPVLDAVTRDRPGTALVDPAPILCPEVRCSTYQDGHWIWKDETHVSIDGARTLIPALTSAAATALQAAAPLAGPR
jgi:hypothetical protein